MKTASNQGRPAATFAAMLCALTGMSALFVGSFSIMLPVVTQALGIGVTVFALVFTIVQYVTAAGAPFAGRLIDRVGPRIPAGVGIIVLAGGLAVLSRTSGQDALLWTGAVLIGIGAAVGGPIAYVPVVASWYSAHRALGFALVLSISPQIGQAVVAPLTRWLIDTYDWRAAYLVLGAIMVVFGSVPAFLFLKNRPVAQRAGDSAPEQSSPGLPEPPVTALEGSPEHGLRSRQVYTARRFWLLTVADCLAIASIVGVQTHLVNWLGGERAVGADVTTLLVSTLAIAGLISVVAWGYLADKVASSRILIPLYLLAPAGIVVLLTSGQNTASLIVGVVLLGAGLSAVTMLLPYLITRFFGTRATAEVYGVSLALNVVSIGTGPLLIGWLLESIGSYVLPMWIAVGATAVSALFIAALGPYRYAVVASARDAVADLSGHDHPGPSEHVTTPRSEAAALHGSSPAE